MKKILGAILFCFAAWCSAQTVTSLTVDPGAGTQVGSYITWSATVTGGTAPYTYEYWVYSYLTNTWTLAQPYGTAQDFTWAPGSAGNYAIQVWVRNAGSNTTYDAWLGASYTVVASNHDSMIDIGKTYTADKILWFTHISGGTRSAYFEGNSDAASNLDATLKSLDPALVESGSYGAFRIQTAGGGVWFVKPVAVVKNGANQSDTYIIPFVSGVDTILLSGGNYGPTEWHSNESYVLLEDVPRMPIVPTFPAERVTWATFYRFYNFHSRCLNPNEESDDCSPLIGSNGYPLQGANCPPSAPYLVICDNCIGDTQVFCGKWCKRPQMRCSDTYN